MLFRRRRVGVSYELCPAEKISMWAQRNLLVLVGGSVGIFLWFLLVIFATKMMNWLNEGSDSTEVFDDGSPTGIAIKLIGGLVVFILVISKQSK